MVLRDKNVRLGVMDLAKANLLQQVAGLNPLDTMHVLLGRGQRLIPYPD